MTDQEQSLREQARSVIEKFFDDIRLARATELARLDKFAEAEAVLMNNGVLPESARELDLLARIAARQARFEQARQLWNKASQLEPSNPLYQQSIASLTPARRLGRIIALHEGKLLNVLVFTIAVFAVAVLFFVFRR